MEGTSRRWKKATAHPKTYIGLIYTAVIGLFLLSILLFVLLYNGWQQQQDLARYTVNTTVRIVERMDGRASQYITYEFTAEGPDFKQHTYRGTSSNMSYQIGDQILIVFDGHNPNISRIREEFVSPQGYLALQYSWFKYESTLFLFIFAFFIFCIGGIIVCLFYLVPATRLERMGLLTDGTITSLRIDTGKNASLMEYNNKYYAFISYQVTGEQFYLRELITWQLYHEWTVGAVEQIRYLPDEPEIARIEMKTDDDLKGKLNGKSDIPVL